ncbi:hypothetical protein [Citrobacter portucalensis]|uniref:hypothetical protein n=2 Tax=Citrobacter TaxID=544 RepID=UPI0019004A4B|nr:hypothetical protein [Citrobacter portucalensis]MBJ8825975.1 hypothetical protein [Citrobacter freundii]
MNITQIEKYFTNDAAVEEQDKEIWINGSIVYSCKDGIENDSTNQVTQFGKAIQTVYVCDEVRVQHNHHDDSFYFHTNKNELFLYTGNEVLPTEYMNFIQCVLALKS